MWILKKKKIRLFQLAFLNHDGILMIFGYALVTIPDTVPLNWILKLEVFSELLKQKVFNNNYSQISNILT